MILAELSQSVGLLKLIQGIARIQLFGSFELSQGFLELVLRGQGHSKEGVEHWILTIKRYRLQKILAGLIELFFFVIYIAKSPSCIMVPII